MRLRSLIYYFLFYLENAAMIGAWYAKFPGTSYWFYLPLLLVVVTVQLVGFVFLQLYLFYFAASPAGTALCGLCCPGEVGRRSAPTRYHGSRTQNSSSGGVQQSRFSYRAEPSQRSQDWQSEQSAGQRSRQLPPPDEVVDSDFTAVTEMAPRIKPRSRYLQPRSSASISRFEDDVMSNDGYFT